MKFLNKLSDFFVGRVFSQFFYSTIIKTVEVEYSDSVYNLSISDDETYLANEMIVHNCRSLRVMLVKDEFAIPGLVGQRASEFGPVSANLSYKGWLKRQPKEVRALVNVKKTYTRQELAELESFSFL